jgi:hypothetical protein
MIKVEVIKHGRAFIEVDGAVMNQDGQGGAIVRNLNGQSSGKTGSTAKGAKLVLNTGTSVHVTENKRVHQGAKSCNFDFCGQFSLHYYVIFMHANDACSNHTNFFALACIKMA